MTTTMPTAESFPGLALAGKLNQDAEAAPGGKFPTGEKHRIEPKFDGWRILAHVGENGVVTFYARSGKTYKIPHVAAELASVLPAGTWIDGEAVALTFHDDGSVSDDWGSVQSALTNHNGVGASKVSFMAFDILAHGGIDARPLPYSKRRALLEQMFAIHNFATVKLTPTFDATAENYLTLVGRGFEGAMVKRLDARYASGQRGKGWVKAKHVVTVDAVVMGFKPGQNGFAGMVGAIIFGQFNEIGQLVERGRCSGMDMRTRQDMTAHPHKWIGTVVEIAHMGVMKDGLRHPQFKRRRKDKTPDTVKIHNG